MEDPRRARPYERQQGVVAVVFRRRSAETVEGRMLITTGQQDAYVVPENRAFRDTLRRGGFSYQYREAPGLHDWTYWLDELPLHVAFHAGVLHR